MNKCCIFFFVLYVLFSGCNDTDSEEQNNSGFIPSSIPACFPNSKNTGLINSSILTTSDGFTVTTDGQIVENLEITGTLYIEASDVTIKNCRIWGGDEYGVFLRDGQGIIIQDNVIGKDLNDWPNGMKGICIRGNEYTSVTIQRNYIRFTDDGIFMGSGSKNLKCTLVVQDNYITYVHSNDYVAGNSIHDHKGDGMEIMGPLVSCTIKHNSINIAPNQTSCILVQSHWGAIDNFSIDGNWLNGGGYTLYTTIREYGFTNVSITNNRLGRDFGKGHWSRILNDIPLEPDELNNNVWDDTNGLIDGMNYRYSKYKI